MCAHNFMGSLGEDQIADLRPSVDCVEWLEGVSVPESYMAISGSSACGQETILMGRPADSFYSRSVFMEFHDGLV